MGLFTKKRSEELELPKFPDLPEEPSFPSYEPEFADREESPDEFGIPERKIRHIANWIPEFMEISAFPKHCLPTKPVNFIFVGSS